MVDQSVVATVRRYLAAVQGEGCPVSFGVVFGSQVTGKTHRWSDIDLVVVSPRFDESLSWDDVHFLWRLAAKIDVRIEPIPCGERQWAEDTRRAIVEIARREGQRVDMTDAAEPPAA